MSERPSRAKHTRRPAPAPEHRRRPSDRRVKKWQELRHWQRNRDELRPATMHTARRLFAARDRGMLYHFLPPHLENPDLPDTAFRSHYTMPFLTLLMLCTLKRGHTHLHATRDELARLLGCAPRSVYNATREAARKGWCTITALFEEADAGDHGRDPDGRELKHRQRPNAYAPGPLLLLVWGHWQAMQRELAQRFDPPHKEGGNGCQASPDLPLPDPPLPPHSERPASQDGLGVPARAGTTSGPPRPAPAPPARRPRPARPPRDRSAGHRGQARAEDGASRPRAAPDAGGGPELTPALTAPQSTERATAATRSDGAGAAAGRPRPLVLRAELERLPDWYTAELRQTGCRPAELKDLLERGDLWLRLTADGATDAEAAAEVAQLKAAQARRREGGGAGAVCFRQRGAP